MGRKSRVEDEPGALRVLLCLIDGEKTPKEIAKLLSVSPPTVVFHLNRLRRRGFVRRLEKVGKEQPYQIVWPAIYRFFLETIEKSVPMIERFKDYEKYGGLVDDPFFQTFIEMGLRILSEKMRADRRLINFGLERFFKSFREIIVQLRPEDLTPGGSPLFKEFLTSLLETKRFTHISFSWLQALEKLNMIKPLISSKE